MAELRYPIGMQTFSEIIKEGYTYVDKTAYIKPLLEHGHYIFLSRPRRFGKSLLLSTLESFFEGKRELFKGLAIDDEDVDWISYPVFHFDLNAENFSNPEGLEVLLESYLRTYEDVYECPAIETSISQRFKALIKAAYDKTGQKVVILVDEYDKPLLNVEDNKDLFEKNQEILKSFFGNLKTMDRYIRFAFITGVARFSKVSIFSDLNNLDDISLSDEFADICGWSECELIENFRPGIEALAKEREEDFEKTMIALRSYYDGYLFTYKGSRLYNPFSVLLALRHKDIESYWFATGTPTFLVKRIRSRGIYPPDINGVMCSKKELMSVGLNDSNPIPLMFQTGYLTIGSYNKEVNLYELRFPNKEVEVGFYEDLLPIYVPITQNPESPFNFKLFKLDLYGGHPEKFMQRLVSLFKDLPGEDHNESSYRAITYLLAVLSGTQSIAEHHGYKGRSDIEVLTGEFIYIFEFKYNKSVDEAMSQIYSRDYIGRYQADSRKIYLIRANFSSKKEDRGLHYKIEVL